MKCAIIRVVNGFLFFLRATLIVNAMLLMLKLHRNASDVSNLCHGTFEFFQN